VTRPTRAMAPHAPSPALGTRIPAARRCDAGRAGRRILGGGLLLLALGGASASAAVLGDAEARALGPRGEVYQLRTGSLGKLAPGTGAADAGHAALALETLRSDEIVRQVVPGTEDADVESEATLLYEPESDTLYLAWVTRFNILHSRITVLWLRDGAWSQPIELTGSAFSEKSTPRIAFTSETLREQDASGAWIEHTRSIVHTLWTEITGYGERVVYAPVVFEDGVPAGDISEITLDPRELVTDAEHGSIEDMPLAPTLRQGPSGRGLLATLGDTELFSVLSLEPVPLELTRLGDGVRASIVPIGRSACGAPDGLTRIAAAARDSVLAGAGAFHASVLQHVAGAVTRRIESSGCAGGVEALANAVYEDVLEAGSDALNGRVRVGGAVRASIVPIGRSPFSGGSGFDHRMRIGRASSHPAPPRAAGRPHVLAAANGQRVVIAWESEAGLAFSESAADSDWSELNVLRIDEHLDLAAALELLERRAGGR
jgi:hypothetical protein